VSDTFSDRQQASFDRAQAQHDAQEPPEPCRVCDGTCKVEVEAITDSDGCLIYWPTINKPEVECPFCVDGVKPVVHHEVWCGGDCECYKAGQEGHQC